MQIITTPMCEEIVKLAGIMDYTVNKYPDQEEGDLAVVLSETETKMDSIKVKVNTFSQIEESVLKLDEIFKNFQNQGDAVKNPKKSREKDLQNKLGTNKSFFKEDIIKKLDSPWIDSLQKENLRNINRKIKVQVYSNFLKEIVNDMGYTIIENGTGKNNEKPDFIVYPDYMENQIKEDLDNFKVSGCKCIKVPSHGDVPLNPVERAVTRYNLLEKELCMKP